jgi:hypothetical protein
MNKVGKKPFGNNGSNLKVWNVADDPTIKSSRVTTRMAVTTNWKALIALVPLKLSKAKNIMVRVANMKGSTHWKKY